LWHLSFFISLLWYPGIEYLGLYNTSPSAYSFYITIFFSTIFCSTPFWFRTPKTGFGDPVTSPLILAKFAVLPAFVSLLLYRVIIYITFLSPCLLRIRLLQYRAAFDKNLYHFSITVLIQDNTFTIPCQITFLSPCLLRIRLLQYRAAFDINLYHFSITVLIQDNTFTIPCSDLI
jgi:hypothetical protein